MWDEWSKHFLVEEVGSPCELRKEITRLVHSLLQLCSKLALPFFCFGGGVGVMIRPALGHDTGIGPKISPVNSGRNL